jgi:adenine-specific DNA-methyltransferase
MFVPTRNSKFPRGNRGDVMGVAGTVPQGFPGPFVDQPNQLTTVQAIASSLSEAATDSRRLLFARTFGYRIVAAWWGAIATMSPLRAPLEEFELINLPANALALADRIGSAIGGLAPESAAYEIGAVYTGMLTQQHRAEHGTYYTPPALSARLIAQAEHVGVDWKKDRILDPACGGGAFLTPIAQKIIASLSGCSSPFIIQNLGVRLRGYEIDPFSAWLSQVALDAVVAPISKEAGRQLPVVVSVCDSLHRKPPRERFDLVIGNPPYGRIRLSDLDRERFKRSLFGHANLYGLFTDLALQHLKTNGVIAYVTPTSFLAGEYFKKLRNVLGRNAPPQTIDFVTARSGVFDDVLQETVLATYQRGRTPGWVAAHQIAPTSRTNLNVDYVGLARLPADLSQPWLLPRTRSQVSLLKRLRGMRSRLSDWGYSVSTGPLVWNRYKAQLAYAPGQNRYPLIWAEAITSDGRFIFRAKKRNHAPYFEVREGDDWMTANAPPKSKDAGGSLPFCRRSLSRVMGWWWLKII